MMSRRRKIYLLIPVLLAAVTVGVFLFALKENDESEEEEVRTIVLEPESVESGSEHIEAKADDTEMPGMSEEESTEETGTGMSEEENTEGTGMGEEGDGREPESVTEDVKKPESQQSDWVGSLAAAENERQIMVVAATGSSAVLSLHNKEDGENWREIFSTGASIGKNGIGKSKEGDQKTPRGNYRFTMGFGIKKPENVNLPYTVVDENSFWVDDPSSGYYNRFVSLGNVEKDWNSAESLAGSGRSYNYALAINYNESCIPGKGSAIFLHCLPTGGAGCIAVSEDAMVRILKETLPDCLLIIDSASNLGQ